MAELTDDTPHDLKSAAKLRTGFKRRRVQAEMAVKYCNGSARRAETTFGWGREAVHTGLNERRSGLRCLDAYELRGRKETEERCPELVPHIRRLVDPQAQADPRRQTPLAYTRITARAVREALRAEPDVADAVPCRQTMGTMLNRLGYRLRRVRKTRPEEKFPRPTRSSRTSAPPGPRPRPTRTPCGSPSTPRRRSRSATSRGAAPPGPPNRSRRSITTWPPTPC